MVLENVEVAFAQVTGEGNDNGQYLVGVYLDKKQKKVVQKYRDETWSKNNTGARDEPFQSYEDWCATDEESGNEFLWIGCNAAPDNPKHGLDYVVGEDDDFTMKDFGMIGAGSKVTVEFNMYITKKGDKKKENVGRSLIAIQLLELVPFEGGGAETTLKGKKLKQDGTTKAKAPKEGKKKKKKNKDK